MPSRLMPYRLLFLIIIVFFVGLCLVKQQRQWRGQQQRWLAWQALFRTINPTAERSFRQQKTWQTWLTRSHLPAAEIIVNQAPVVVALTWQCIHFSRLSKRLPALLNRSAAKIESWWVWRRPNASCVAVRLQLIAQSSD